jgi:hypothetical protein
MMAHTIALTDSTFSLLTQEAQRERTRPNDLAERLLAERLTVDLTWRAEFVNLLTQVHKRMKEFNPAEIESDITVAYSETKAEHRAHRRPA